MKPSFKEVSFTAGYNVHAKEKVQKGLCILFKLFFRLQGSVFVKIRPRDYGVIAVLMDTIT